MGILTFLGQNGPNLNLSTFITHKMLIEQQEDIKSVINLKRLLFLLAIFRATGRVDHYV